MGTTNSDSAAAALVLPGPRDDQQGLGLVDPGDVVLGAVQHPVVAVPDARWWRCAGCWSPASGSVIAKTILDGAAGQAGQPGLALLVGAELGDHLGRDRGRHEQQEQRRARGGDLLADQGELGEAAAAPAVLLGDVDADEPGVAEGLPQLGAGAAGGGVFGVVARARTWWRCRPPRPAGPGARPVRQSPRGPRPECDSPFTSDLSAWMRH